MLSYLGVWSLGLFCPTFFSTSSKKNHTKDAQKKKQNSLNVQTVLGHMLHLKKGVQSIKSRHSGNMW